MNEYDSSRILDLVKKNNYESTNDIQKADCYILNTCHIREKATDKVYHEVGRVKKVFKSKKKPIIIIAGCVAQAEGEILLEKEKYIDGVVGPQSYHEINKIISGLEIKGKRINETEFEAVAKFDQLELVHNTNNDISSFLTIQEGCDKFCKFCVVPYTRGPEFSRPPAQIISEAKKLVDNGCKEIILLGQNVNAYNYESQKLSDLLNSLSGIKNLKRIRYTTSHPNDFTEDLIEVHGTCKKLMPLLHLPVQSGSTEILKSMNRNHSVEEYLEVIEKLKAKNPSMKFSSDFIIAYPGETENDFNKTLKLMKQVEFINSYSFIHSARPGTPAANLEKVDLEIAKERLSIFQEVADRIKSIYRNGLINSNAKVLFENTARSETKYFGRDEYFNSVIVHSNEDLSGTIRTVKIKSCNHNTLFGEVISHDKQREYAA
tara:strand:- start:5799 stop:7094 length:1296 start_codon:yes stop_codon:yes gene_type:complete